MTADGTAATHCRVPADVYKPQRFWYAQFCRQSADKLVVTQDDFLQVESQPAGGIARDVRDALPMLLACKMYVLMLVDMLSLVKADVDKQIYMLWTRPALPLQSCCQLPQHQRSLLRIEGHVFEPAISKQRCSVH